MANRRFGNQGGPPQRGNLGNRSFGPSSNISPWQGGAPPGAANNQSIQNQLALALTNLIQQSAQPPSNDGPPSLLNLNTSPGFFNQDQYHNQNQPRFPGGNRGRQDFRRSEPYVKNRMSGWRSDNSNNRNRGSNNYSPQKKDFNSRDNKGQQRPASRDNSKKLNDKPLPKQESKPAADTENGNNAPAPAATAAAEQPPKKEEVATAAVKTEPADEPAAPAAKKDAPKVATKFDGIPNGLLHCCVCNKSMWDGESFQNHVGGKAHKQMISSLEESFQITVNILRENVRLTEERRLIEYERVKRSRRYHHANNEPESTCNMCDLKFMGKIVLHRQSEGHQRLKRFLHPKCTKCHLEFTSRMEWVDHLFMPDHLQKVKEYMDQRSTEYGEYKQLVKIDIDNDPLFEENMQNEDDNPVMELHEDLTNLYNRIPVYKHDRILSKSSLKPATGFTCDLCKVFMASEEEANDHAKSFKHYTKFVETVKSKYQRMATEKEKKEEEEATKQEGEDAEMTTDETAEVGAETENGNGNAKGADDDDNAAYDETVNKILDDIYTEAKADDGTTENVEVSSAEAKDAVKPAEPAETKPVPVTPTTRATRRTAGVRNGPSPQAKRTRT